MKGFALLPEMGERKILLERKNAVVYGAGGKLAAVNSDLQLDDAAFQGVLEQLGEMRMLRRSPGLAEVADTAAFLASDRAGL